MDQNRLLREVEVSRWVSVSTGALRRWRKERRGPPFVRLGRRAIRYRASDVALWLDSNGIEAS
jgi:predicted DNA-binding transcriptional regulator AlpA